MNLETDVIEIENWLQPDEILSLKQSVQLWKPEPSIPNAGHFANQLVSMQHYHDWYGDSDVADILQEKLEGIFGRFRVAECVYQELHLPWDIHCDYDRKNVQNPRPWRSVLIPLESSDSTTIIFKQTAEYNDFWKYKQTMPKSLDPISQEFWQENLDFCWPEDREWLTVDHVSKPWAQGNMLSFPRNRLHSSDNFHKKIIGPKRFIQILIDKI